MERPLVSIVVPVYNVSQYLKQCLDSIIAQTYKNLEIILIDDGSTDDSGKICDEYAIRDKRINVIHKENGGLSDARNKGIDEITGSYVAFIDSDDYINNQFIQRLLEAILTYKADIAICKYKKVKTGRFVKYKQNKLGIKQFTSKQMLVNWHGKYKHIETMAWNKLYKSELFIDTGIRYPKGFYNEDVQTTHLLIDKANNIVISNQVLYYYVQRKSSITGTISTKKIEDCIDSQKTRLIFFKNNGFINAYERLQVKLLKYYILIHFKLRDKYSKEILYLQYKDYRTKNGNKIGLLWERSFFLLIDYYFKIYYELLHGFPGNIKNLHN